MERTFWIVFQMCIRWSWSSPGRLPHSILKTPTVLGSYEKLSYWISRLMMLYQRWPRTISHFSSSTVSWKLCCISRSKHRWNFCRLLCDHLAQIELLQILNKLVKGNKGIKPAMLWEFLDRMATTLSQSQNASNVTIPCIWPGMAQILAILLVPLIGSWSVFTKRRLLTRCMSCWHTSITNQLVNKLETSSDTEDKSILRDLLVISIQIGSTISGKF